MAEHKFKVGDTVRLKSGGPLMTVTQCDTAAAGGVPMVTTIWFDDKHKQQAGTFLEAVVKGADDSPTIA